jgi:hypothetical protein
LPCCIGRLIFDTPNGTAIWKVTDFTEIYRLFAVEHELSIAPFIFPRYVPIVQAAGRINLPAAFFLIGKQSGQQDNTLWNEGFYA